MIDNVTILNDDNVNIIDSTSFITVYHTNSKNDNISLFYDYTNGDETNFTLTFYVGLEDIEDDYSTVFPVDDENGNANKVLTADDSGKINFNLDSIDKNFVVKVENTGGTPSGEISLGFRE